MNNRNIEIKVRLNRKEAEALNKRVKNAGSPVRGICDTLSTARCREKHRPRNILSLCENSTT